MRCHSRLLVALFIVSSFLTFCRYGLAQESAVRTTNVLARPSNLDFESGTPGQVPDGWVCRTTNYRAELSDQQPQSGKRAASLQDQPGAPQAASSFGNLMQAFDATAFRGHRVRFKAFVRSERAGPGSALGLWMRVDRTGDKVGFFDNMQNRPIRSSEWKEYEIVGDVDDDAAVINFGLLLVGSGKAWIDTASFEDLGKLVSRAEPARPFSGRGLDNVIAFTRLLGYVRHFHPSDEAAATNWDAFAVQGITEVEGATEASDLATRLDALFRPIAPTVRIFPTGTPPKPQSPPLDLSKLEIVSWHHLGFGTTNTHSIYQSERVRVPAATPGSAPDPLKPFNANLGGGVSANVPLAVYADAQRTLPRTPAPEPKTGPVKYSGNDRATRLADVALTWNVMQHFYPYFDVVKTDWPQVLRDTLNAAATDADAESCGLTLRRMIAQLRDGHGNVSYPGGYFGYSIPVVFGWIEGQLAITAVAPAGAEGLQAGDVVLSIDGRPALQVIDEKESLISGATPQWRRAAALLVFLSDGPKDSEMKLEVQDEKGQRRSVTLRRSVEGASLFENRPAKIAELRPGIYYVALDRINDEDFKKALPELEKATGIVFDLRGYPRVSPMVISHLIDQPVTSARWMIPIVKTPDHLNQVDYETSGRWDVQPIAPHLKARIAFLTDGRAISYAESYMGIVEAYKLAAIVGEPTAGTNGDINSFMLPGGYRVIFTGMKVLKHDGSQHHGIGIKPTAPVSRTIRGLREQRDEQLERALEIVGAASRP